jgi:hypothetical protein
MLLHDLLQLILVLVICLKVLVVNVVQICRYLDIILDWHREVSIAARAFQIKRRTQQWRDGLFVYWMYIHPSRLNVSAALAGQYVVFGVLPGGNGYPSSRLDIADMNEPQEGVDIALV